MAYKPRVVGTKTASDALPGISEAGTAAYGSTPGSDTRDDQQNFVLEAGVQDVNDSYENRFIRVDVQKSEHIYTGGNNAPEHTGAICKAMKDTESFTTCPNTSKMDGKSAKDPQVRTTERSKDAQMLKDRIFHVTSTRCNRVTMKMDVSYTDHSHIIGKGGLSIKKVMEETRCHVHFPDSNRSSSTEKSNQVSIAGDIEGVERARSLVRNLTPLIFSFELPILASTHTTPDGSTPYVIKVQEEYNVQVIFRTRPKLHATLVMVKGVEWEVQQVKQATLMLIDFMCENLANQISVQMSMEISPHHHPLITGKNHSNLKAIIQNTNTQIMFPDAQDPNIPSLKKSNVTINGNIHNVYKARQQLMGSLPLVLMFDLPEDTNTLSVNPQQISKIQSSLDVTINIRQKAKQNTMACIIKGTERCATNIYEARNRVLAIREPCIVADIPTSYFPPQSSSNMDIPPTISIQPISPILSPMVSPPWQYPVPFGSMMQHSQYTYSTMDESLGSSGYHSLGQFSGSLLSPDRSRESSTCSSISSNSPLSTPSSSPRNGISAVHRKSTTDSPDSYRMKFSSVLSEMNVSGCYHGPTLSKHQILIPSDYEQKHLPGTRIMQNRPTGGHRVPAATWSGYGTTHTNLAPAHADPLPLDTDKENDIWNNSTSKQTDSNFLSTSSANANSSDFSNHISSHIITYKWPDLPSLLTSVGLEKYIELFASQEIDLMTFPSLTDQDLVELGVTAFGARRKILLTISELNKRPNPFSAAPGAERRSSLSVLSGQGNSEDNW